MKSPRYPARLAAVPALLGVFAVAAAPPVASAAPRPPQDGWVRIAHLSPQAPAMDMYLYPFGNPAHPAVLKDVGYGDVSAYRALGPGQYTVAMRGFDAPATSRPALISSFMVKAKTAYTVAALGPDPGLRVEVLKDQLTAPKGKTLVRVLQASLKQGRVSLSFGGALLAQQLTFASVTPYQAVSPGAHQVKLTTSGANRALPLRLTANSVHTIVVLDGSSGLKADDLADAAGIAAVPAGSPGTGLGGTAPRPPADLAPWLVLVLTGSLVAVAGAIGIGRSRRGRVSSRAGA